MKEDQEIHKYDDIINLPHYFPPDKPRMPRAKRAAQFAAFAALTGMESAIEQAQLQYEKENFGDKA